jgi:phosphatidylserine decarboxylase
MKIAKEGLAFILPSLLLGLLLLLPGWWAASIFFLLLSSAFAFFFRDPQRTPPQGQNVVVSPADGKVIKIEDISDHPEVQGPAKCISIFLSLFDVHFTRSPITAEIKKVDYHPGKFFPAYREQASLQNEANSLLLSSPVANIFLRQMVGIAARRIKCYVKPGERVEAGQKIGLMYFGSRVDVYLPGNIEIKIRLNQKVKGGLTIAGEIKNES